MYRCTYKYLDLVINIRFNLSKDTLKKKEIQIGINSQVT